MQYFPFTAIVGKFHESEAVYKMPTAVKHMILSEKHSEKNDQSGAIGIGVLSKANFPKQFRIIGVRYYH